MQQKQPELHNDLSNLEVQRDRVLAEWKVAKRAESKERVKEALDRLIRYIVEPIHPKGEQEQTNSNTAASLVTEAYQRYESGGFKHTDVYFNSLSRIASQCGLKVFRDDRKNHFTVAPTNNWGNELLRASSIHSVADFLKDQQLL